MNKLFKMSLFKKTFLIILCGLSIIEGIHLYLDYENEKRDTIGSFVRNRSDIVSILSELETENEGKSFSLEEAIELLDDPLKNLGEYFSITNFEGDVLYECKNSSYFSGYQRIYDSNISEINVSVFSNEDIKRIESYILNNKNITLKITYQGKKEQDNSIIPTYLSINDQLIIGEKNINEKIYESHMHMYRGGEIYYQDDDSGENTKSLVFIKEEYFNKMREISNELYDEYGSIGASRIGYKIENKDLYISAKSILTIDNERCYLNYVDYYKSALENILFQSMYPNYSAYKTAIIIVIVMSLILSYMVTYRIKKIYKATIHISHKDFNIKLKDNSKDEIGDLSRMINSMSEKIGETVEQLNKEIEKVKELESLRKDFINQFTHEMKTPLGIINGYSELLEETETEEERQKYLDIINKETVRINDLVQGMLSLARLEARKVELHKEVLDLEDIVTEVIDEFEILLMKKKIKVEVKTLDKHIIGDKQQLITIIRNFISNAIKHTNTKILITINQGVTVYNEGKQIDEDKIKNIWYTFVTHDQSGSGLGLAICRSIFELHNYSYGVINKEDGVEFYFKQYDIHRK